MLLVALEVRDCCDQKHEVVAVKQLGRRVVPADENRSKVIVKSTAKQLASITYMALAATTKL